MFAQRRVVFLRVLALLLLFARSGRAGDPASLQLQPKDHISIIGGTLADRMQHDGWLETYLASRFPKHDLVFRNLGFAADELKVRLRSANFGTPDQWLTKTKTDVVFAFFGYNESFAGPKGLDAFKKDLENFIKNTTQQQYNGRSVARLVLFSPIAHENLHDRNLPDGSANNKRLALYTAAMAEIAKANNVPFVDLFHATQDLYAKSAKPLTINGIHLTELGNEQLAQVIDKALFANEPEPKRTTEQMEKIRQAVLDRNFHWFNRYRTVDGYSIYGGRAGLRFVGGQTNKDVMDREMEILDIMTANRDMRVWAAARGADFKVDDANTPDFIPVISNKPGPLEGGKHIFVDPEEAIQKMTVAKGMKVNVFASEKDWPELAAPVQMAWDTKGRLWVAVWPTYPHWKPRAPMHDKLLIFEDTKGTGKADKMTVFADNLHCPTGFEFWNGGVIVAQAPDILFLKDTTGSGKADLRQRIVMGVDSADTHHTANSFVLDPGGALYFQEGTFHHTQVETPYGPPARNANAGVFRYEPRTQKFEVYVDHGFANPHGHVFDRWGQDIVVDGTGAVPYHAALFSGQTDFGHRHAHPPTVYKQKTRPCAGTEILSSSHFPPENQGNFLVANVIDFRGILQYKLKDKGASFEGIETEPILYSSDLNFRPSDIRVGPDGAVYFLDWHNPIIGHMQHNLRDPNRDHEHGRIYRVTYEGRPLLKPAKIAGEPIEKLLELLKSPEDRVRYWTRIELGGRDSQEVIAAAQKWLAGLDPQDAGVEHHKLEILWLHQNHNVVNENLLKEMLRSPEFRARAAATRVLCYWRDRVQDSLQLLHDQINDVQPRVRLEAVRALSFFNNERALNVALELLTHPDDQYLQFVFNETLNTLERRLGGGKLDRKNIAVSLLKMLDKEQVAAQRKPALIETISRHGSAKELKVVWDRAASYDPALRKQVLGWLAEAASTRRVQPAVSSDAVRKLLAESSPDPALQAAAIRLATVWKVKEAAGELRRIAQDKSATPEVRFAAIDSLAGLPSPENTAALRELAQPAHSVPVRFRAAVALAEASVKEGADAAAKALAAASEKDDPSSVIEAFLVRKGGSDQLAAALAVQKLSADNAKRILRSMFLAGHNDAALAEVAAKFAGLEAAAKPPSPKEVAKIVAEVTTQGDAARGERIFRRADLGCLKCHSISKAGGQIGPDLGPVGGASPLDYIVTSILDPSLSIKEEYLTKVISTSSGLVVTGIPVERDKNKVVLKDATGKRITIAAADIEEEANGKSLMPEGITRFLTRGEQLDLIRFVSELGKPGPYQLGTAATVRRWKKLREVTPALREEIPNREVVRDSILGASPDAWETVYSMVSGKLPLDEFVRPGQPKVLYLQGEVQVRQGGAVEILVESKEPVTFWVDEDPFEKQAKTVVPLSPGRHRITVRVAVADSADPTLRLGLRKPANSQASFEVVHAD
jgi:putative heme-binding domain-containing protein